MLLKNMREVRKFMPYDPNAGYMIQVIEPEWIKKKPDTSHFVDLEKGLRIYFSKTFDLTEYNEYSIDNIPACFCMPTKNTTIRNFYAIPIYTLDIINAVNMLNIINNSKWDAFLHGEIIDNILDGFEELRPDRILCAEWETASDQTKSFLVQQGYSKGQPKLGVNTICYLGTFKLNHVFAAAGTNGLVLVNRISDNMTGPVYVSNTTSKNNGTYIGYAIKSINGRFKQLLQNRYEFKLPVNGIDKLVKQLLSDI